MLGPLLLPEKHAIAVLMRDHAFEKAKSPEEKEKIVEPPWGCSLNPAVETLNLTKTSAMRQ
jgi:hypothetical protein